MFDSPYMANQNKCFLNDEQLRELADIVIEQFGVDLSGDELNEAIQLLMEDIPGIEMETTQAIHCVLTQVRNLYHDTIKRKN